MVRHLFIWPILALLPTFALAVPAEVQHYCFQTGDAPYVELHLWLGANATAYERVDESTLRTRQEVSISFYRHGDGPDSLLSRYDKYVLHGPLTAAPVDFRDVKRYHLEAGNYSYLVTIRDLLQAGVSYTFHHYFTVPPLALPGQSDVQLLHGATPSNGSAPQSKNGLILEPLLFRHYGNTAGQLLAYHEVYGSDGPPLRVRYLIEGQQGGRHREIMVGHQVLEARSVYPLLLRMDIRALPSGKYAFVVELRNELHQLISMRRTPFYRSNPHLTVTRQQLTDQQVEDSFAGALSADTARYLLRAVSTVTDGMEVALLNELIARGDLDEQRRYLLAYFLRRDPQRPSRACRRFMALAGAVDQKFGCGLGYGFESARGLIFMKYGAPDDLVSIEDEPDAPPYEIWIYYHFPLTRQTNVKFLFYNPNLTVGAYELLHSTAITEQHNPQWPIELYRKRPDAVEGPNYLDATSVKAGINRRAMEYFSDFQP